MEGVGLSFELDVHNLFLNFTEIDEEGNIKEEWGTKTSENARTYVKDE